MLEPGKNAPLIKGGNPVCSYEVGKYRAMLVQSPESFGPIKYPHVLIVYPSVDNQPPVMFVTAEESFASSSLFMGVFNEQGHSNLGSSDEYADINQFEKHALATMMIQLGLESEKLNILNDTRKGGKFGNSGCMSVISIVALGGYGVFELGTYFI